MAEKRRRLTWMKFLAVLLDRNPGMKKIDDPEKLEYYRTDLNVDLPPLIRDLMLKSLPDLILQPTTEENLVDLFAFAREHRIPLTVRGAGTWGYGGAVPTRGGILIDLSLMSDIDVNPETLQLTVGPGARFLDIQRELEHYGLDLSTIASGKGGTLIGWMATGGMGIGTFHHGPVRNQIVSLRVITPDGTVRELPAEDPEISQFLSTEGQMGIIVKATLRVSRRPARWYPFVLSFEKSSSAYAFAKGVACHPSVKPEDIVVYHSEFVRALGLSSNGDAPVENRHLVLVAFPEEMEARDMEAYLSEHHLSPVDEAFAHRLWEKRFLPMSIKHLGPSLLASEMILPLDQVAP